MKTLSKHSDEEVVQFSTNYVAFETIINAIERHSALTKDPMNPVSTFF